MTGFNGLVVLLLAVSGVAACAIEPGSGACTETTITIEDRQITDPLAPLTLTARTTVDDTPVQGIELAFFIKLGKPGKRAVGVRVGEAVTGDDGVAHFEREDGVDGVGFSDERVEGYTVELNPITKVDGVQYCRSRVEAKLTVG